ncbi:hypothetical protein [Polyangium sorediatum]|uniref:hypothetical protein n=1 Tax=Polyangium sorediatum TaxID=889274 RepID=UPI002547F75F|nr:hypothetical protein [Polyangium sorediatum]
MSAFRSLVLLALAAPLFFACSSEPNPPPTPEADPAHIDPPPQGQGFQIETNLFEVPAGVEKQDCYFFKVRDLAAANGLDPESPVYVNRVQIAQKDGSHHMNVFRVRSIVGLDPAKGAVQEGTDNVGECFKSANWADWPLVANSQIDGKLDWSFPEGVANEFMPDEWLMLQTHYVNASTQGTPSGEGKVNVNFWTIPKEKVTAQLGTLFATKQSIRVCASNPTPSFDGSCQFKSDKPVHIIGANGHFHSRGKQFDMFAWDGVSGEQPPMDKRFYSSQAWDEPPMLTSPELDLEVPANSGVFYTCSYQWQMPEASLGCDGLNALDKQGANDCCYTFGPIVEANEHCNIFVYYYPKADDINCF